MIINQHLPTPRAVLFDWDSTLVDNWQVIQEALNATLVATGRPPWTRAQVLANATLSARDRFPEIFGAAWEEARVMFHDFFAANHLNHIEVLDGAPDLLVGLRDRGIYQAIVSNKTGPFLRAEVHHLGWDGYFGRVVGATDAARDKPAADPVHLALQDSGIAAGPDVWFVGDAAVDLACAANAGCTPVLIRHTPPAPGEFDDTFFACYVSSRWDLLSLVAG